MSLPDKIIAEAIDQAPLNRGLKGADWLAFEGNVSVTTDDGDITLFDNEGDGIYSIHVLYRSRGRKAIGRARDAIRAMFVDHGAKLIIGMVPAFRGDVKLLARWAGMRSAGIRYTSDGPCELFVLSKFQWKVANQCHS